VDVERLRPLLAPLATALRARCLLLTPEGKAVLASQPAVSPCPARLESPRQALCDARDCPFRGTPYFAPVQDEGGGALGHLFWCMGEHPTDRRAFADGIAAMVVAAEHGRTEKARTELSELQHELEIARKMQESLVPAVIPDVEGLELAASLKPTSNVGGDYYDILPLGGGYVGLVIADVSGHGVSSGMMMTSFRMALLTELSREFSPGAVFRRINNLLFRDCDRLRMFVSAVLAVYEPLTGNLQYANAGHNPPRMRKAGRPEVMRLAATGVPLGMLEDMTYDEGNVVLETGDALLMYTDGLVENRSLAGVPLGEAGLDRMLAIAENKGAAELLNFVLTLSERHLGGAEPKDDVTIVVATRTW